MTPRRLRSAGLVLAAVAACGDPPAVRPPTPPRAKVRLRAFTETSPVRAVVPLGADVFVDKGGTLERWRPDGTVLELSPGRGLPDGALVALAADARRDRLWVIGAGGVGYYDRKAETFEALPPSPVAMELGLTPADPEVPRPPPPAMTAAVGADDGLWIGHPRGLYFASKKGGWASTPIGDPVTALFPTKDGWLWVGTDRGLVGRAPSGKTFAFGPAQGCEVVIVRWIAAAPGGGVLVVGEDAGGHQRLAIGHATAWRSYKLSPTTRWLAGAAGRG